MRVPPQSGTNSSRQTRCKLSVVLKRTPLRLLLQIAVRTYGSRWFWWLIIDLAAEIGPSSASPCRRSCSSVLLRRSRLGYMLRREKKLCCKHDWFRGFSRTCVIALTTTAPPYRMDKLVCILHTIHHSSRLRPSQHETGHYMDVNTFIGIVLRLPGTHNFIVAHLSYIIHES